jgi:hypothetical protein
VERAFRGLADIVFGIADLVLPSACAGCAAERLPLRYGVCADCVTALEALRPYATAPAPRPGKRSRPAVRPC